MGGAAIGALIAGPAGLVVGGLSGSSRQEGTSLSTETVNSVKLVVYVSSADREFESVTFQSFPLPSSSPELRSQVLRCQEWVEKIQDFLDGAHEPPETSSS